MKLEDYFSELSYFAKEGNAEKCIEMIELVDTDKNDYQLTRAFANILITVGMPGVRCPANEQDEAKIRALEKAMDMLISVVDVGEGDADWNKYLAYALWFLGYTQEVLPYASAWLKLSPNNDDAVDLITDVQIELNEGAPPLMYDEDDGNCVEEHITEKFGEISNVFHEMYSPDIHLDICVVQPNEERDTKILCTMGMGCYKMEIPDDLTEYKLNRAELFVCLPPYWKLDDNSLEDNKWYWIINVLKSAARLPVNENTWLAGGHTISAGEGNTIADCVGYNSVIIKNVGDNNECILPNGENVNFYMLIPIYENELNFKLKYGSEALFGLIDASPYKDDVYTVSNKRADLCSKEMMKQDWAKNYLRSSGALDFEVLDSAQWHAGKIPDKGLPLDELTAYNHLAIYLRWCIEHDIMSEEFIEKMGGTVNKIKCGEKVDLRPILRDNDYLNYEKGALLMSYFNEQGKAFAEYYYNRSTMPHFPCDIDNYAEEYFGSERYNSDEFQDEAYLFVPFDEKYYQDMADIIQRRWNAWTENTAVISESGGKEPSLGKALRKLLDCECEYFPPMRNIDRVMSSYNYALSHSSLRKNGGKAVVPILIPLDDEYIWENIMLNISKNESVYDDHVFDEEEVRQYRNGLLDTSAAHGEELLKTLGEMFGNSFDLTDKRAEECKTACRGEELFQYIRQGDTVRPLLLAKIPTAEPSDVFAYLPVGGEKRADPADMRAIAKCWYDRYGAIPAVISADELEFILAAPVDKDSALKLAFEHFCLCPDLANEKSVEQLADELSEATVWHFKWNR